jgi:hypothetical protein
MPSWGYTIYREISVVEDEKKIRTGVLKESGCCTGNMAEDDMAVPVGDDDELAERNKVIKAVTCLYIRTKRWKNSNP